MDDAEEANIQSSREKKFAEFKQMREMVLQMREKDRVERNALKERQIQQYEEMQVCRLFDKFDVNVYDLMDGPDCVRN